MHSEMRNECNRLGIVCNIFLSVAGFVRMPRLLQRTGGEDYIRNRVVLLEQIVKKLLVLLGIGDIKRVPFGRLIYASKFGWIDGLRSNHPKFATSLASDYQVPDVVTDIAVNKSGAFRIENDWWGMKGPLPLGWSAGDFPTAKPPYEHQWIRMDGAGRGGVVRHSTVHEDYTMGTAYYSPYMEPNAGTKQNRKMGITVNGQGNHQLFVNGLGTRQNRQTGYQEITGITGKNASVIWRDNRYFRNIGVRVFATTALHNNGVQNGPWWFSHIGNAYVGFRAAQGGWTETSEYTFDEGTYFILDKPYAGYTYTRGGFARGWHWF